MRVDQLIAAPPKLHVERGELVSGWKLANEELLYLDAVVAEGMRTVETGAGASTIVFAMKGAEHTCIVPDAEQVDRIRAYCEEQGVSLARVAFIIERSEIALPRLTGTFDLALIDGSHSFPVPFIDWYYIGALLRTGGTVIVDDMHIWTCATLAEFLMSDEDWELTRETLGASVFKKVGDRPQARNYTKQGFVMQRSRQGSLGAKVRYVSRLVRQGKFYLLADALRRIRSGQVGR